MHFTPVQIHLMLLMQYVKSMLTFGKDIKSFQRYVKARNITISFKNKITCFKFADAEELKMEDNPNIFILLHCHRTYSTNYIARDCK